MMDMFTTELLDKYPPMDAADVPDEWIEVAKCGYSMHGLGLLHNILAAVAPLIQAQAPSADELAVKLRDVTANLNARISERAEQLAIPLIKDAQDGALQAVVEKQREVQRQADLVAELRRRMAVLERNTEKWLALRAAACRVLSTYDASRGDPRELAARMTLLQEAANA